MGEIADSMIAGETCSLCGTMFKEAHGYPVVCNSCWKGLTPEEKKEYTKATNKEL